MNTKKVQSLILLLIVPFIGLSQKFENHLRFFENPMAILKDSNSIAIGGNLRLNNFLLFDGMSSSLSLRHHLNPNIKNTKFEVGLNIENYFNKTYLSGQSNKEDFAVDGYNISTILNARHFFGENIEFQVGVAPQIGFRNNLEKKQLGWNGIFLLRYKDTRLWIRLNYPDSEIFYQYDFNDTTNLKNYFFSLENHSSGNINISQEIKIKSIIKLQPYISIYQENLRFLNVTPSLVFGLPVNFSIFTISPEIIFGAIRQNNTIPTYKKEIYRYGVLANVRVLKSFDFFFSHSKLKIENFPRYGKVNRSSLYITSIGFILKK